MHFVNLPKKFKTIEKETAEKNKKIKKKVLYILIKIIHCIYTAVLKTILNHNVIPNRLFYVLNI